VTKEQRGALEAALDNSEGIGGHAAIIRAMLSEPEPHADAIRRLKAVETELRMEREGCLDCQNPEEPFTKRVGVYFGEKADELAGVIRLLEGE